MKRQKIGTAIDFKDLLLRLGKDAKNVCLMTGGEEGWTHRMAWNPCGTYAIAANKGIEDSLFKFINKHQSERHLIVGFVKYDLGYSLHRLKPTREDTFGLPNVVLFAYDNYLEKSGDETFANYGNPGFHDHVSLALERTPDVKRIAAPMFTLKQDREDYHKAFEKIRSYIYEGVIYQINLTQRLTAEYPGDPRVLFADLGARNSGRMIAYMEAGGFELLSLSPERFIRTKGRIIETAPIKGTRYRGKTSAEEKYNEKELLASAKEEAELNMITDLLRNDLGKVCSPGTVKIEKHREIDKLVSVMHTYSQISGRLAENVSPVVALLSMFPGGSVTGCPKRKAMELIDGLEESTRGAYCGSMFVIDGSGNLDSNILIRTVVKKDSTLELSGGGGIVYDSVEEEEYQECLDKLEPIIRS